MEKLDLKIVYEGKDITSSVQSCCTGLTYTDVLSGESDELELEFEDTKELWRRHWNPKKGDKLQVRFGYPGKVLDCGSFEVDDIEFSGPPDMVRLKGLATGLKPGFRTQVTKYHLDRSLGDIAREIAGKYGLTVSGAPTGITLANVYQDGDDLHFLRRLAERYGYGFKVAHGSLVFYRIADFEARSAVFELTRDKVTQYSFRTSGEPVCKSVELKYYDPKRKGLVSGTANNSTAVVGEKVRLDVRCSSLSELQAGADAEMDQRKREEDEISVTRVGEPLLIAGVVVTVKGFGVFDREYLVRKSVHAWTRLEGYTTEIELQTKAA